MAIPLGTLATHQTSGWPRAAASRIECTTTIWTRRRRTRWRNVARHGGGCGAGAVVKPPLAVRGVRRPDQDPVAVQQVIPVLDAAGRNHGIDGLASAHAESAQRVEVLPPLESRFPGRRTRPPAVKSANLRDLVEVSVVVEAREHLGQNQIANGQGCWPSNPSSISVYVVIVPLKYSIHTLESTRINCRSSSRLNRHANQFAASHGFPPCSSSEAKSAAPRPRLLAWSSDPLREACPHESSSITMFVRIDVYLLR